MLIVWFFRFKLHLIIIRKNVLVTIMAVNMEINTPIAKVMAKPLTTDWPNPYKITAVIKDETFEAQIDDQALLKPKSKAVTLDLPHLISSFILSKIKILASTAIPTDKTKPAIPAKVRVMGGIIKRPVLKIAKTSRV